MTTVAKALPAATVVLGVVVLCSLLWDLPSPIARVGVPLLAGLCMLNLVVAVKQRQRRDNTPSPSR